MKKIATLIMCSFLAVTVDAAERAAVSKPNDLGRLTFQAVQADDVDAFINLSVHGLSEMDTGRLLDSIVDKFLGVVKKDMTVRIELLDEIPTDKLKPNAKRALAEAKAFLKDSSDFKANAINEALVKMDTERNVLRAEFAKLKTTLDKKGIDLSQASLFKVDTSDVRPAFEDGGSPFEGGDLDVIFTHKGRRYTLTLGECSNPPGFGWLANKAPRFRDPDNPDDVAARPKLPPTLPALKPAAAEGDESDAYDDNWSTDFEAAKALAAKEKKLIYLDFTGSDWCPPCKALHKNVLVKPEFLDYAKENLVLVVVDFPRKRKLEPELAKSNKALAKKFGVRGYPTIVIIDADGKELHRHVGYGGQKASAYVAGLKDKLGR